MPLVVLILIYVVFLDYSRLLRICTYALNRPKYMYSANFCLIIKIF